MFVYTFINGECPISYKCKLFINHKYNAGSDVSYYPEMEYVLQSKNLINYYFAVTTILYLLTLFFVIFRTNTFSYFLTFTFAILLFYFILIRNQNTIKQKKYFIITQEITKYTLLFAILLFIKLIIF
jgi:1,4-dihydroxy-2-naphthoate octaprenyltransferase